MVISFSEGRDVRGKKGFRARRAPGKKGPGPRRAGYLPYAMSSSTVTNL